MMKLGKTLLVVVLGAAVIAIPVFSQAPGVSKPSFEVASVKHNTSGDNRVSIMNQPGGRFVATGIPLKFLMTFAYRVRDFQISGGPDWITSDRWDIEGRAEEESIPRPTGRPVSAEVPPRDERVSGLRALHCKRRTKNKVV